MFDAVELRRGPRVVLVDATFTVARAEAWFVLGPNGAGKSTLLDAALGVLRPARGSVRRDGCFAPNTALGPVPQRSASQSPLPTTVAEFVGSGLCGITLTRDERAERIAEGLAQVALMGVEKRSFHALSEGQRQRVMLARALARRPRLLVLDEPTASLDPRSAHALWELGAMLVREHGHALLCATHDLAAASRLASHVALLVPDTDGDGPSRLRCGSFDALRADGTLESALGLGTSLRSSQG